MIWASEREAHQVVAPCTNASIGCVCYSYRNGSQLLIHRPISPTASPQTRPKIPVLGKDATQSQTYVAPKVGCNPSKMALYASSLFPRCHAKFAEMTFTEAEFVSQYYLLATLFRIVGRGLSAGTISSSATRSSRRLRSRGRRRICQTRAAA